MALVTTTHGDMDDSLLEKREIVTDDANEHTVRTEYWLDGELVHASAHIRLKWAPNIGAEAGAFGG